MIFIKFYYFDNAATTRLDNDVLKSMLPYTNVVYGNASSSYKLGRNSKMAIESSRQKVANVLGCKTTEIYFTSGGTESDNTAIFCSVKRGCFVTDKGEHSAVYKSFLELKQQGKIIRKTYYLNKKYILLHKL